MHQILCTHRVCIQSYYDTIGGSDYDVLTSVLLTFSPDVPTIRLPVTLIDDNEEEETEQFMLLLSQSSPTVNLTLSPTAANASIVDNDGEYY